jgi:methylated-DNA-[protein]-cysteine S-methyltransferase
MARYDVIDSPLGPLLLTGDGQALTGLRMDAPAPPGWRRDRAAFAAAAEQLDAYFGGELIEFDLPLSPRGTPFQLAVWRALRAIRYGTTITYGELAARLGRPHASRAVGAANARNPIGVIVPCHRVIGASGALTGYGGGLDRKRRLLELEAAVSAAR